MKHKYTICAAILTAIGLTGTAAYSVTNVFDMGAGLTSLEFVHVGNAGNAPDTTSHGAVDYDYGIGMYEVTAAQYVQFLNAVAATDTYGLYDTRMMNTGLTGGCRIQQSGASGSYTYSVAADRANRPVNWVDWGDAARFANWLDNGQPVGMQDATTTEDGSYTLLGKTSAADLLAVIRNDTATYVIPTEDEWYKAAFHKNDGMTGNYWTYATGSDTLPSRLLTNPDPGNNANYYKNGYSVGSPYYLSDVGDYENSESAYGTFDQNGNVWEWNESLVTAAARGLLGGSYVSLSNTLPSTYESSLSPMGEFHHVGFRIAQVEPIGVPEPATVALLGAGSLVALWKRKKGKK